MKSDDAKKLEERERENTVRKQLPAEAELEKATSKQRQSLTGTVCSV
ncbi:hypothetical protein ACL02S_21775 [Nocardia sp. 004]